MSLFNVLLQDNSKWKNWEKFILKFFFIYFAILIFPIDWKFYQTLFSIDWLHLNFYDLFVITKYSPVFFGLEGCANWLVTGILALAGAAIWYKSDSNYNNLYYWLRVVLRYRLAIGIIAYGLIKLFPLQMPYPSLSNLHTNYGDFYAWKIYFHTLGIAQWYESFLGLIEVLAGLLLLNRRTTTFGAGIIIGFTGNVFVANIAYQAGDEVYSLYLFIIALFLFVYDTPRLYNLLMKRQFTLANNIQPVFNAARIKTIRNVLKISFVVFILLLTGTIYANYHTEPYKIPNKDGLKGTYGYYNVRQFKFNDQVIPYSKTDSNRWQNVVFEKWATISVKTAKSIKLDRTLGDVYHEKSMDRNFESAGVGGRRYFAYTADTVAKSISLANKNKNHADEKFELTYQFINDSTLVLKGTNEKKDSIIAVLDRINKKYMLLEGRRKPVKL